MTNQTRRVYDAEFKLHSTFDWAAASETLVVVTVFGSTITVPVERKFGDLGGAQRYLDLIIDSPAVRAAFGPVEKVVVVERGTNSAAHYVAGMIALASQGRLHERWALREIVVLHELAHHLTLDDPGHEANFAGVFLWLLDFAVGPEAALLLTEGYVANAVNWVPVAS